MDQINDDTARRRNKRKRTRKIKHLRVATWNVTSFTIKGTKIIMELKEHYVNICSQSEIKMKCKGNMKINNYVLIYTWRVKSARAMSGVSLFVLQRFENNKARILQTTLQYHQTTIAIFSVRTPPTLLKKKGKRPPLWHIAKYLGPNTRIK